MILTQLDILQPKRTLQTLSKQLEANQKQLGKYLNKTRKNTLATVRSQYMIDDAVADARRAISLNEDIVLACLFVIAVLSFSTVSILANTLYTFMLSAAFLSELSGVSMLALSFVALSVLSISILWLCAWMQNLITVSLMEAITRKRYRSLRMTIRKSLRLAPTTVAAWLVIMIVTFVPAIAVLILSMSVVYLGRVEIQTALPYLVGAAGLCIAWILHSIASYSLLPQVMLFNKGANLGQALTSSRLLVKRKGRFFIICTYLLLALSLTILYYVSVAIESSTGVNQSLTFLTLMIMPLTVTNALMTMLYRKRKLARR